MWAPVGTGWGHAPPSSLRHSPTITTRTGATCRGVSCGRPWGRGGAPSLTNHPQPTGETALPSSCRGNDVIPHFPTPPRAPTSQRPYTVPAGAGRGHAPHTPTPIGDPFLVPPLPVGEGWGEGPGERTLPPIRRTRSGAHGGARARARLPPSHRPPPRKRVPPTTPPWVLAFASKSSKRPSPYSPARPSCHSEPAFLSFRAQPRNLRRSPTLTLNRQATHPLPPIRRTRSGAHGGAWVEEVHRG